MKWIRYSRYTGEDFGIDSEDLLKALSDFLLESGEPCFCLLNAGAGWAAGMKAHLAGIRYPRSTGEPVSVGFKREF